MFYNIFIKSSIQKVNSILFANLMNMYPSIINNERYGENRGGKYYELDIGIFLMEIMNNKGEILDPDFEDFETFVLITKIEKNNEGFEVIITIIEKILQENYLHYSIEKF